MNRLLATALALGLATGCSPVSLSGSVSGTGVGNVRTAVFDHVSYSAFGFTIEADVLLMSDIGDSCGMAQDMVDVRQGDCVDTCADMGAIADEYLGRDDYWWTFIALNPYEENVGTYAFNSDFTDPGDFTASFASLDFSDVYNTEACEAICDAGDDVINNDNREATGGSVVVDVFENNAEMKGSLDITYPGDETVTGKFKAEHCDLEDFVLGLILSGN